MKTRAVAVVSCHAKDLQWGPAYQVNIQEVIPGTGLIDYKTYLREFRTCRWMLPAYAGASAQQEGLPRRAAGGKGVARSQRLIVRDSDRMNRRTFFETAAAGCSQRNKRLRSPIIDTHIHLFDPTRPQGAVA